MRFSTRNPAAAAMAATGLVLLLGSFLFHVAVKPPDVNTAMAALKRDEDKSLTNKEKDDASTNAKVSEIQTRLWSDPDDQIAPEALNRVTTLAKKHGVKMTTFRPQKEVAAGALNILPFFVSVDGSFPAVFDFVKDVEESSQLLLIVNLVQLSSSDQTTHNVTASLGISAYIDPKRGTVGNATTAVQKPAGGGVTPTPSAPPTGATHGNAIPLRKGGKA